MKWLSADIKDQKQKNCVNNQIIIFPLWSLLMALHQRLKGNRNCVKNLAIKTPLRILLMVVCIFFIAAMFELKIIPKKFELFYLILFPIAYLKWLSPNIKDRKQKEIM